MANRWNIYQLWVHNFIVIVTIHINYIYITCRQYTERLLLFNRRDWSCKFTGKGQLTFAEAFASEEKARRVLDSFPEAWKGPLYAFIQHSFASLDQISSQFLDYIKTNYIPGEDIKIEFDNKKYRFLHL